MKTEQRHPDKKHRRKQKIKHGAAHTGTEAHLLAGMMHTVYAPEQAHLMRPTVQPVKRKIIDQETGNPYIPVKAQCEKTILPAQADNGKVVK